MVSWLTMSSGHVTGSAVTTQEESNVLSVSSMPEDNIRHS